MLISDTIITGTVLFGSSIVLTCCGLSGVGFLIGGVFIGSAVVGTNVADCINVMSDYISATNGNVHPALATSDMLTCGAPSYATGAVASEHLPDPNVSIIMKIQGAALMVGSIVFTSVGIGAIISGTVVGCATIMNECSFVVHSMLDFSSAVAAGVLDMFGLGYDTAATGVTDDTQDNRMPGYVPAREAVTHTPTHTNVPPQVIYVLNLIVQNPYSPIIPALIAQIILMLSAFRYI